MLYLAKIAFWFSSIIIIYSYIIYYIILKIFSISKKENNCIYNYEEELLPIVNVLLSVYNEEEIIKEKLNNIFNSNYPKNKLYVYVGSDCSSDKTDDIINQVSFNYSKLVFYKSSERKGKANILNILVEKIKKSQNKYQKSVFLLTDANVIFSKDTIYHLVKHFKNEDIGQVSAYIINMHGNPNGIAQQEGLYIQRENRIKYLEGLNWGTTMGAFGACYAMRSELWVCIPENFLMEDFYISMKILLNGKRAISDLNAICYEDVPNEAKEEFKRKSRIQTGNLQNLGVYWKLLFQFNAISFCFISHKLIRWLGPVFIILSYISSLYLTILYTCFHSSNISGIYLMLYIIQTIFIASPVLDKVFTSIGINLVYLRLLSYFYIMNIAFINGFILYVKGVKNNTWNSTKRNF